MAMTQEQQNEQKRRKMAEQIWLHYFNRVLFEKGLITERERNRMTQRIENRKT